MQDGLSQSTVTDIAQDNLGYIWLGTQSGLNRFDGVNVDIFLSDSANPDTIEQPYVRKLLFDGDRTLWIYGDQTIDSIDVQTLKVTRWSERIYKLHIRNPDQEYNAIHLHDIALNPDNTVSVLTSESFVKLDIYNNDAKLNQRLTDFVSDKPIEKVHIIEQTVYFLDKNCLHVREFSGASKPSICSDDVQEFTSLKGDEVHQDTILLFHKSGFSIFDTETKKLENIEVLDENFKNPVEITDVLSVKAGYWLATVSGLRFWDKQQSKISKSFRSNFSDVYSISADYIFSLFQSQDGLIWIGNSAGVNYFSQQQQFVHLLQKRETVNTKSENYVTSITRDYKGDLWIGTYSSGLYTYSNNFAVLSHIPVVPVGGKWVTPSYISKVFEDQSRNLWILSTNGLFIRPFGSDSFFHLEEIKTAETTFKLLDLATMIEDRNGDIWLGSEKGFYKVEISQGIDESFSLNHLNFIDYTSKIPSAFMDSSYGVYTLFEDLQGYIWLGGSKGVIRFNPISNQYEHFLSEPLNPQTLSSNDVNVIYEDLLGVLWVGTVSGLNRVRYDDKGNIYFQRITKSDGFSDDYICSILSDKDGNLWLSTVKGISKYHPDRGLPTNFNYNDGLQYSEFFTNAQFSDTDGGLYFGGLQGITYFYPEEIKAKFSKQQISIVSVKENNQTVQLTQNDGLYFAQVNQNSQVGIRFAVLNYIDANNIEFRYRITGLAEDWIELEGKRFIHLHNVQQERLDIEIQMRYKDGAWGVNTTKLELFVERAFWSSTVGFIVYFIILLAAIISISAYLYYLIRRRIQNKESQIQAEKAKSGMLLNDKKSLVYQLEDLQYSMAEQSYQLEQLENKVEQSTINDQLTGFKTKYYLRKNIKQELQSIVQTWRDSEDLKGIHLGVFAIDIDNLAVINAQHGHLCGNEILRQVAESLRSISYGTDTLVRWEGATLVILSRAIAKREQMVQAEKIRNIIASRKFDLGNGLNIDITCSIGFTRFPFIENSQKPLTWEQIIFIAEKALWVAKTNSRNAWVGIFSNQFTRRHEVQTKLSNDLPALILSGQLDYVSSIPKSKKLTWH
ncbi:MAG: diguanylate cyclase [Kangiellaceae bacterium]|nr:diguanylate cyclase [Kangiellaceae bacterium]